MDTYEKKYNEAIEKAKKYHEECKMRGNDWFVEDIEDMFPELKNKGDDGIRNAIYKCVEWFGFDSCFFKDVSQKECLAWLEKQGEKSDNKFKVGDWVVTDKNNIVQIKAVNNIYYTIDNGMDFNTSYVDRYWHLWTIQDAKDGDILVCADGRPFIFRGLLDKFHPQAPVAYCGIDSEDGFSISSGIGWWTDDEVFPATKEQRNVLFIKMKEAGYEWDDKNKELREIEQNSAEDNCKKLDDITTEEKDRTEYKKGFECGKQRVLKYPEDFGLCKKTLTAWSEEDESQIELLIGMCDEQQNKSAEYSTMHRAMEELKTWLKSLRPQNRWISVDKEVYVKEQVLAQKKDKSGQFGGFVVCCDHTLIPNIYERYMILGDIVSQNTWKPSEEQMQTLYRYAEQNSYDGAVLTSLYKDLKKLKE